MTTNYWVPNLPNGRKSVTIIQASERYEGMRAWVQCSDKEWRQATLIGPHWQFDDRLTRFVDQSMATLDDLSPQEEGVTMQHLNSFPLMSRILGGIFIRRLDGYDNRMRFECNYCTKGDYSWLEDNHISDAVLLSMGKHFERHHPEKWSELVELDGSIPDRQQEQQAIDSILKEVPRGH